MWRKADTDGAGWAEQVGAFVCEQMSARIIVVVCQKSKINSYMFIFRSYKGSATQNSVPTSTHGPSIFSFGLENYAHRDTELVGR